MKNWSDSEFSSVSDEELLIELIKRLNMLYGDISFPVDAGRPGNIRAIHKKISIHKSVGHKGVGHKKVGHKKSGRKLSEGESCTDDKVDTSHSDTLPLFE